MTPLQRLALREPLIAMLARIASPFSEGDASPANTLDILHVSEWEGELVIDTTTSSWSYPPLFDEWHDGVLTVTAEVVRALHRDATVEDVYKVLERYAARIAKDLKVETAEVFARPKSIDEWFIVDRGWTRCTTGPFAAVVQVAGAYCAWLKKTRVRTELVRSPGPIVASFLDTLAPAARPRTEDTELVLRATEKTVPFIDTVQAIVPQGYQLPLTEETIDPDTNSLSKILSEQHLRTYLLTLCALYDQERPHLFFEFNPRQIAREYLMKPGEERGLERKAEELRRAMKTLERILIVKAGGFKIENDVPQALVQHISGEGRHLYSHPALMQAALRGHGLVQTPRAAYRNLDSRNLPVAVALSVLIRNRLSELRKRDVIRVTPKELVDACGRSARAAASSLGAQVKKIVELAREGEVATLTIEGDAVLIDPTGLLREAYASTMAGPARHAAKAARKTGRAGASAKLGAAKPESKS